MGLVILLKIEFLGLEAPVKNPIASSTLLIISLGIGAAPGCVRKATPDAAPAPPVAASGEAAAAAAPDPCALALASPGGDERAAGGESIDRQIDLLRAEAAKAADPCRALERLGWLHVARARSAFDSGHYRLAEACALCIESKRPGSADALLLRGHALQSLHRFADAEVLARKLVDLRESAFAHGLLGDALLEQGHLGEAADSYQKMLDLKPCLQSYSRAAHLRWLKGDLPGAIELARMAYQSASPRDPESAAWASARLALLELQAGDAAEALSTCEAGLRHEEDHATVLLVRGRVLLALGRGAEAIASLRRATAGSRLPEALWMLADALHADGRTAEAEAVEADLESRGALEDPRTFALYLATRDKDAARCLALAREELHTRADVFTHDALAWALLAAGSAAEARPEMERALAEGTEDARLFLHAGVIAGRLGRTEEARSFLAKAAAIESTLLPSERERLRIARPLF